MLGQTIAHYRVLDKLGEGGMGVVYKALDTHLDRVIALKLLLEDSVRSPDRMRRFVQEAKAASALNHPNIVSVYDIDHAGELWFIAMEYAGGRTLEKLIGRKGLPLRDALVMGAQIAGALAAAHAAGIVHRDLKPANIVVGENGQVKLVDFGLAKLTERLAVEDGTVTAATAEGAIIGTVAYMSPEQAEGRQVDARTDIFSFGAVLYEMLAGRRAFQASSTASTLAAILREEPAPLDKIAGPVPRQLEAVISLCLKKDPARRFQHMDDVEVALQALLEEKYEIPDRTPRAIPGGWPRIPLVASAALALVAAVVGATWWVLRSPPSPTVVLRRLTADSGLTTDPALSPDGKLMAYASDRAEAGNLDIWVRQVAGGEPVRLTRDPADEHEPTFSADGTTIAFRSEREGGGIYSIPALGGEPRLLARQGHAPRFSPDGQWLAYTSGASYFRAPYLAPAGGGANRVLPRILGAGRPIWSPDGHYLLLSGTDLKGPLQDRTDWWVLPIAEGAQPVKTGAVRHLRERSLNAVRAVDWAGDRVIFSASFGDSTNIWEVALSGPSFRLTGSPRRLTMGTDQELQARYGPGRGLVFATQSSTVDLWAATLNGSTGRSSGDLRPLTRDAAPDGLPSLSAGGKSLVFLSTRSGNNDVWLKNLETGRETPLTATPWQEGFAVIAPDGTWVFYGVTEGRRQLLYRLAIPNGLPEPVCENCGAPTGCSRDGRSILVQYRFNEPRSTLGVVDTGSGLATEILKHGEYGVYRGHFSPDEHWVVFHADAPGRGTRVFIAPFRGATPVNDRDWIEVTHGEAWTDAPQWSPDGNLVYYLSDRDGFRCIWAQRLEPATKHPVGEPSAVLHLHNQRRSVSSVGVNYLDLAVARDKIVFTLGEVTGNIWVAEFQ